MLEKLKALFKKILDLFKSSSNEEKPEPVKPTDLDPKPEQPTEPDKPETPEPTLHDYETTWNYGYWNAAKTYDDINATLVEAQKHKRPILVALSKPEGCNNCTNYWRHVTCDGVFDHDASCDMAAKNHPIVEYAKEKKLLMLYLSPSKFPNIGSKIMGREYDPYLHKPVYYPIYFVISVKDDVDFNEVPANEKILNAGNDEGDIVNFIMGYIGISGKPVLDYQGNKTELTIKTNETGWDVFKSNLEAVFSDTSKTHGISL